MRPHSSLRHLCAIVTVLTTFFTPLLFVACATTPVPTDPTTSCSIAPATINGWFETGVVTPNGVVKPADSVGFVEAPNCSFYDWSQQMFLWATSPSPAKYGGGGRVFNSQVFFDVSPLDANHDRTLIAHSGGLAMGNLAMRAAQVGQHGLQVIVDKRGRMLEIEEPQFGPTGRQLILDRQERQLEIGRIALDEKRAPRFFDITGNVIEGAHPLIRKDRRNFNETLIVGKFVVDKIPFFLDFNGSVVEAEQGQADGAVLMAQNGSLVYYTIAVNDVYAYFLTGAKNGAILPGTQFPTTNAELTQVENFAIANGLPSPPFPDREALAVELKTAWVEASTVPNQNDYITMTATIPTYDTTSNTTWTPNGQKTVKMALVGMHVVGTVVGHPEMVWATFDHENNAPNDTYQYNSSGSGTQTVNPDFSAAYLFCAANPAANTLNVAHMQLDPTNPANIVAIPPFTISPSNIIRGNAWGAVPGVKPNPAVSSAAASNSQLIASNNSVRGQLDPTDVRRKYIMTGSTWTIGGAGFNGNFGVPGNTAIAAGRAVGTSQMANTTMETFQQGTPPTSFNSFANNCFSCHGSNTTDVSHIYTTPGFAPRGLKPLF